MRANHSATPCAWGWRLRLVVLMMSALAALPAAAQGGRGGAGGGRGGGGDQIASLDERVTGFKKLDGFFPLYWDEAGGTALDGGPAS